MKLPAAVIATAACLPASFLQKRTPVGTQASRVCATGSNPASDPRAAYAGRPAPQPQPCSRLQQPRIKTGDPSGTCPRPALADAGRQRGMELLTWHIKSSSNCSAGCRGGVSCSLAPNCTSREQSCTLCHRRLDSWHFVSRFFLNRCRAKAPRALTVQRQLWRQQQAQPGFTMLQLGARLGAWSSSDGVKRRGPLGRRSLDCKEAPPTLLKLCCQTCFAF